MFIRVIKSKNTSFFFVCLFSSYSCSLMKMLMPDRSTSICQCIFLQWWACIKNCYNYKESVQILLYGYKILETTFIYFYQKDTCSDFHFSSHSHDVLYPKWLCLQSPCCSGALVPKCIFRCVFSFGLLLLDYNQKLWLIPLNLDCCQQGAQ